MIEAGQPRRYVWIACAASVGFAAWLVFAHDWNHTAAAEPKRGDASARSDETRPTRSSDRGLENRPSAVAAALPSARRDNADSPPGSTSATAAAGVSADETDPLNDVKTAALDPSAEGTAKLVASMASTDAVIVAEAAKALIARRATDQIAALSKLDLATAAGGDLSIIDALGKLGGAAGADDKTIAVERLIGMLAEEKQRNAKESEANLLQIYEALGETQDPRAEKPLEADLLDPNVGRAPKVVIVNALVSIGQSDCRDSLVEARTQQANGPLADAFEEELRVELAGVIDKALTLL